MNLDQQILKCRDDKAPIDFARSLEASYAGQSFKLLDGSDCSWLKKEDIFGPEKLRPRIEPWLTALFQSEHLSLLVGSGLWHAIYHIATGATLPGMDPPYRLILSNYNFRCDHTIDALGLKKEKCVQISFSFNKIAFEN